LQILQLPTYQWARVCGPGRSRGRENR